MITSLESYVTLLKRYNEHTNIYSKSAYDQLAFHVQDGVTLGNLLPSRALTIFDFGSGSGLPALPLAIMNADYTVYAIESKSRKTTFLTQVKEALALSNLHVITSNLFEWQAPVKADIITAKAFASPEKIQKISKKLRQDHATIWIPMSAVQIKQYREIPSATVVQQDDFLYLKIHHEG